MKLLIISHTEHYINEGVLVGWGPTIREINYLSNSFSNIFHIACLYEGGSPPASSLPYASPNIEFIPISPFGGKSIVDKVNVLREAPRVIQIVQKYIHTADAVQIRVPTGIANYLLPWLTLNRPDIPIWVKYAGNWVQENPPLGYGFQRWWLKNNFLKCPVTINGKWPNQSAHCISFENPCLDMDEREIGLQAIQDKQYTSSFKACFVGRIEAAKGVGRILESAPVLIKKGITQLDFIGEGPEKSQFEYLAKTISGINITFHGALARNELAQVLIDAHFLLLPSTASEGFPKVIAEGWNYGAIPIVSNVSAIPQYVNHSNGFVWDIAEKSFYDYLEEIEVSSELCLSKAAEGYAEASTFTFEHYYKRIKETII